MDIITGIIIAAVPSVLSGIVLAVVSKKSEFRQADSRWGSLPYPTSTYKFAGNGCGCCAVAHCAIELKNFKNYTPANFRKYMVQFATKKVTTIKA